MKKLVFLIMVSALFSFAASGQTQTNQPNTGQKITDTTKKVAKTTAKGVGKGYSAGKNTVVKGAKATIGGVKKIFS